MKKSTASRSEVRSTQPEAAAEDAFGAIATSLSAGRIEEARKTLEQLAPCTLRGVERAGELALRGSVAYHCRHVSLARGYLSEAERALTAPFADLVCAARIARYRGLLEAHAGDTRRARAWLERAAELIHSALTSADFKVTVTDETFSRDLAARAEATAISQAFLKLKEQQP